MRIAVLVGGSSPERDVSLASGKGIVQALRDRGHDAYPVDPARAPGEQAEEGNKGIGEQPPDVVPALAPDRVFDWVCSPLVRSADVVFNGLHGGAGEDGTVQAILDTAGIPYTGTGVLGSALAMNKDRSKALFREAGVAVSPHIMITGFRPGDSGAVRERITAGPGFPAVVKPNCQGSSVGFTFLPDDEDLDEAVARAASYGDEVIVERFVRGREITAAILGGEPLPLVEIIPEGGFYDYKRKYTKGTSRYVVPAELEKELSAHIQEQAARAYRALACRDYARVDFRLSETGEPSCLEVNTLPGMTELSLVPMAARSAGMDFGELVERISEMALARKGKPYAGR